MFCPFGLGPAVTGLKGHFVARIRTIKPEFPQSESMGRVSRDARLLFIMLWTICDDEGRSRAASRMLASLLFPYDDDAPTLIDSWLQELEIEGCIVRYEAEGSTYLQIDKWLKHQKIDKPSPSRVPPFTESSRTFSKPLEASTMDLVPRTMNLGTSSLRSEVSADAPLLPSKPSSSKSQKSVDLPDWLPKEAWDSFVEMRRKIRAPLTEHAKCLAIQTLSKLANAGEDPEEVLNQSTEKAWRGLFSVNHGPTNGAHHRSPKNDGSFGSALLDLKSIFPDEKPQ